MALRLPSAIIRSSASRASTRSWPRLDARRTPGGVQRHAAVEEAVSIVPGVYTSSARTRSAARVRSRLRSRPGPTWISTATRARAPVNQVQSALPAQSQHRGRATHTLLCSQSWATTSRVESPQPIYDLARYEISRMISEYRASPAWESRARRARARGDRGSCPPRLARMTYGELADAIRRPSPLQRWDASRRTTAIPDRDGPGGPRPRRYRAAGDPRRPSVSGRRDLAARTEDHVRIIAGDGKPAALINVTRQVGATHSRSPTV